MLKLVGTVYHHFGITVSHILRVSGRQAAALGIRIPGRAARQ